MRRGVRRRLWRVAGDLRPVQGDRNRPGDGIEGRQIWLRFATWILLGLEFALAADILRTAVAPTWDDIRKLAVIATIRTMLNYFLAKDIMAFDKSQEAGSEGGAI